MSGRGSGISRDVTRSSFHSWNQYRFSVVVSVEIKAFEGPVLLKQYESIGRGTYEADDEREEAIGQAVSMIVMDILDRARWDKRARD